MSDGNDPVVFFRGHLMPHGLASVALVLWLKEGWSSPILCSVFDAVGEPVCSYGIVADGDSVNMCEVESPQPGRLRQPPLRAVFLDAPTGREETAAIEIRPTDRAQG
jgi:hypothetical protein